MGDDAIQPFLDNWAYLKTELRWLDRLLMVAIARQQQEAKAVNQVAQGEADKVTSHWWKGIIHLNQPTFYEDGRPPAPTKKAGSYSQNLEARIQASLRQGTVLALPQLRDRYDLSRFEKNLLLLALAPEINRRYGRLYDYLQAEEAPWVDLPTVDLCLRLLCRDDAAWQRGRSRLVAADSLIQRGLLEWVGDAGTLLNQQIRVAEPVVNYLLSARPSSEVPGEAAPEEPAPLLTVPKTVTVGWSSLVLPKPVLSTLKYLSRQASQRQKSEQATGLMVLLTGQAGTGKTLAAMAIAADLQQSLRVVDLAIFAADHDSELLTPATTAESHLLLLEQGDRWFGRHATPEPTELAHWWQEQRQSQGITLVTAERVEAIRPYWRQRFDAIVQLPMPNAKAREQLWALAWPATTKFRGIDWPWVAQQLPLTGGQIQAIATTGQMDLKARKRATLTWAALRRAVLVHHPQIQLKSPPQP
jgi:hypothetical protein